MTPGSDLQSVTEGEICAAEHQQYEVAQELHKLKQDLSILQLAIASVIKSKVKADREWEASVSKIKHCSSAARQLRKEIKDANEEHVLVQLSRIEAEKEVVEITSQRQKEAEKFAKSIKAAKGRIRSLRREIDRAKELESKLKTTNSDLSVLQNEMQFVRAMEKSYQNDSQKATDNTKVDDTDDQSLLEAAAEAELIAARKELLSVKEEGFQFMTSMDSIRLELIQIMDKNKHLKKLQGKAESRIQNLNSRLMKCKSELDQATVAEDSAKSMVLNLESALQLLQIETEAANKKEQQVFQETQNAIAETAQFSSKESRLRDVAEELGMAKVSEALAMSKLKKAIERTMDVRIWLTSSCKGSITISGSELEYLSQQAAASIAVAKKKVDAAQAWIEALDAGHKEITMKSALIEKKTRELRAKEVTLIEDASDSRTNDIQEKHVTRQRRSSGIAMRPRKTELRRVSASSKTRRSLSSSSSITVKKRKKMFPVLVKFLSNRRNEVYKGHIIVGSSRVS